MSLLQIQTGTNNPILRQRSKEIVKFDGGLKKFAKEMKKTMLEKDGLGLAAPQVGKNIRLIIVTLNYNTKSAVVVPMLNPEILEFSDEMEVREEGCLSLPGKYAKVERPRAVRVKFFDLEVDEQILNLEGLNARVTQHEIDHLDGILFIDKIKGKVEVEAGFSISL